MTDHTIIAVAGGLNYKETDSLLGADSSKLYWLEALNVRPFKGNGIIRMKGNSSLLSVNNSHPLVAIGTGVDTSGEYVCVVDSDGNFMPTNLGTGTLGTPLVTGLSGVKGKFLRMDQSLLYSNGVNDPFYYTPLRATLVSGTSEISSGVLTVTGTLTSFLSQLFVGDQIIINGETRIIKEVISDTSLKVSIAFTTNATSQVVTRTKISFLRATMTIGGSPVNIRGKALCYVQDRVFIGDGSTLYWASLGLPNDWATTGSIGAGYYANFGANITAVESYKQYLLIHLDNNQTHYMTLSTSTTDFNFGILYDKSSKSPYGSIIVNNEQFFFDDGIYSTSDVGTLGQIKLSADRSLAINDEYSGFINGDFDYSREEQTFYVHSPIRREIWCYFPNKKSTYFNIIFIYSYTNNIWYIRQIPQNVTDSCTYLDQVYSTTHEGNIIREDFGETFDGSPITWNVASQYLNIGDISSRKQFKDMMMTVDANQVNKFNLSYSFDHDITTKTTNVLYSLDRDGDLEYDVDSWDEATYTDIKPASLYAYIYNGYNSYQIRFSGGELRDNIVLTALQFRGIKSSPR